MTRTRAAVRRHNNLFFWVMAAIFVWYAAPLLHAPEDRPKQTSEITE